MKGLLSIVCAVLVAFSPAMVAAGTGVKLIPTRKVELLNAGKARAVKNPIPLPENTVMMCEGTCLVHGPFIQLAAHDKSVFAVTTGSSQWHLMVKEGAVDFALVNDKVSLEVRTPRDSYTVMPAFEAAATGSEPVRGTVIVRNGKSQIKVSEGAIKVISSSGEQIVRQGMSLQLAQVEMPAEGGAAGGSFWASLSSAQIAAIVLGGTAAAGLVSWGIYEAVSGGGGEESPF